jgi:hypothetical protein
LRLLREGPPASCGPTQAVIDGRAAQRSRSLHARFARASSVGPGWPARCGRSRRRSTIAGNCNEPEVARAGREPRRRPRPPRKRVRRSVEPPADDLERRGSASEAEARHRRRAAEVRRSPTPCRAALEARLGAPMRAAVVRCARRRSEARGGRRRATIPRSARQERSGSAGAAARGPGPPASCGFLARDRPHLAGQLRPSLTGAQRSGLGLSTPASRAQTTSVRVGPQDAGAPGAAPGAGRRKPGTRNEPEVARAGRDPAAYFDPAPPGPGAVVGRDSAAPSVGRSASRRTHSRRSQSNSLKGS